MIKLDSVSKVEIPTKWNAYQTGWILQVQIKLISKEMLAQMYKQETLAAVGVDGNTMTFERTF